MEYKDLKSSMLIGIIIAIMAWGAYRLLFWFLDYNVPFETFRSEMAVFITMGIAGAIFFIVALGIGYKKTKGEVASRLSREEAEIRFRIVRLKDGDLKEDLKEQAVELRQEFELLFAGDLLKNDKTFVEDWREVMLAARTRLLIEEQRLLSNNQTNIEAAMWMVILGVGLPAYYIFFVSDVGKNSGFEVFFAAYWPIFSVVIVFEIIAIFFLRLYAQTAQRIERKQNEITNIELRLTSGLMLSEKTNKDKFAELAETLSKEERNFILGKNESSAVLDTDKLIEITSKFTPKIGG